MTIITVKIPDGKATDLSEFIHNIGGEVVNNKRKIIQSEVDEDDEVTHEQFFGENIKRLIKAFGK